MVVGKTLSQVLALPMTKPLLQAYLTIASFYIKRFLLRNTVDNMVVVVGRNCVGRQPLPRM